jgi:hypothetical protein
MIQLYYIDYSINSITSIVHYLRSLKTALYLFCLTIAVNEIIILSVAFLFFDARMIPVNCTKNGKVVDGRAEPVPEYIQFAWKC